MFPKRSRDSFVRQKLPQRRNIRDGQLARKILANISRGLAIHRRHGFKELIFRRKKFLPFASVGKQKNFPRDEMCVEFAQQRAKRASG